MTWQKLKDSWRAKPIEPPTVDAHLEHLDGLTRSAESFRYSILSVEFWISPGGQVREWLRHNTRLAAWLAIPGLLVLPVVVLILFQVVKCVVMLVSIAGNLIVFPILMLLAGLVVLVVVKIIGSILK